MLTYCILAFKIERSSKGVNKPLLDDPGSLFWRSTTSKINVAKNTDCIHNTVAGPVTKIDDTIQFHIIYSQFLQLPAVKSKNWPAENGKTPFSNSLIIYEEKTKEITTVKEVWICDPNYHKIWRRFALIFSKNYLNALRTYIKHSKEYFNRYPKTSKLVKKKLGCTLFFSTHFLVFGYLMKHSF